MVLPDTYTATSPTTFWWPLPDRQFWKLDENDGVIVFTGDLWDGYLQAKRYQPLVTRDAWRDFVALGIATEDHAQLALAFVATHGVLVTPTVERETRIAVSSIVDAAVEHAQALRHFDESEVPRRFRDFDFSIVGGPPPLPDETLDDAVARDKWVELLSLVNKKTAGVRRVLRIDGKLSDTCDSLLTAIWLQTAETISRGEPLRRCRGCDLPFEPQGRRKKDTMYCDTKCRTRTNTRNSRRKKQEEGK